MTNMRRSIQDIVPPARSKPIRHPLHREQEGSTSASTPPPHNHDHHHDNHNHEDTMPSTPSSRPPQRKVFVLVGIAIGVVVLLGSIFAAASIIFHRAEVTVAVQSFPVSIADSFNVSLEGSTLSYTTQSATEQLSKIVARSGTETVEERASGTIVVLNSHSTGVQRLITNTRFESPQGLIYRVRAPVIIPGYTMKNGVKVPGEAKVTVYADEAGDRYNVGTTTFTIPGLKESGQDEMFKDITARTDTPLSGGFVGEKAIILKATRDVALQELHNDLDRASRTSLVASAPKGTLILPETITVTFVDLPDTPDGEGARISAEAIATAPALSEPQLAQLIARENGVLYDGELQFEDKNTFTMALTETGTDDTLSLTISGDGSVVGVFDTDALLKDLTGKDRRNVSFILASYPAIADMKIAVYPFWRGSLPNNVDRLSLKIQ